MKKLLQGIVEFRKSKLPGYQETFARLALGQSPDTLFVACSDSRVVPNLFASTNPGDLFVVRNVGNMIPPSDSDGMSTADESEAAAIEFALLNLRVRDIVVCGHSECGAMQALLTGRGAVKTPNLRAWLRHAEPCVDQLEVDRTFARNLAPHNRLSQFNVRHQIKHLHSYPAVEERVRSNKLHLHGWFFDIAKAEVYDFDEVAGEFLLIDEARAKILLDQLL